MDFDGYQVIAGQTYTVSTTSQSFTLPLGSDGTFPRYVQVLPEAATFINFGATNAVTAGIGGNTTNTPGILVTPNMPVILRTRGNQYVAVISRSAGTFINISPVEF